MFKIIMEIRTVLHPQLCLHISVLSEISPLFLFPTNTLFSVQTDTGAVCLCGSCWRMWPSRHQIKAWVARHSITVDIQWNLAGLEEGARIGVRPCRCHSTQGLETSWSFHDISTVTWLCAANRRLSSRLSFFFLSSFLRISVSFSFGLTDCDPLFLSERIPSPSLSATTFRELTGVL